MMHASSTQPRRRAAFSLLEMVLSLSVLAVAFTAVGSVVVLATKVMPAPDSAEAASVDQYRALTRMVEDLEQARYITGGSVNSITFVVDDRTGDGLPDRMSYAWSGIAGDPLTLTINGSPPTALVQNVRAFSLRGAVATRTDRVPASSEVSNTQLLFAHNTASSPASISITSNSWVGQVLALDLPPGTISYTIDRVRYRARSNGANSGGTHVRLRSFDADTNTTGSIEAATYLPESMLSSSYSWQDQTFDPPPSFSADDLCALTLEWNNGYVSADIEYDNSGGNALLWDDDAGQSWSEFSNKSVLAEAYGTYTVGMPGVELTRTVVTHVGVTLQIGAGTAQSVTARLFREPGLHSAVWDAGFDASPASLDMDGNGVDWAFSSGGAAASFDAGKWTVDGVLYTQPAHNFDEPFVVDLMMGSTAGNRSGATFQINADQSGGDAVPIIVRVGMDHDGSYCVRVYDTERPDSPRLDLTGLGDNPPEVRLLVVPADNAVGVIINGKPAGSFYYEPVAADGLPGLARLTEGSDGFFDHVSIRVGASAVVTSPAGAESDSGSDEGDDGLVGGLLNGLLGQ